MTYFEDTFRPGADAWSLRDRWYEQRKRALMLAALPRPRFANAIELTSFAGILSQELAARCDRLMVADGFRTMRRESRAELDALGTIEVNELAVPLEWPTSEVFDLVVVHELGHHLGPHDTASLIERVLGSLAEEGMVLACHWRHPIEGRPMRGDEVHDRLREHPELAVMVTHEEADFLLDVLVRPPVVSVALLEES